MHPFADLSAYLDGALAPQARTSLEAHLASCALCSARLAELRETARLIAGLASPVPMRSLVPRVSVPFWVAPLRTLSTFASGAAVFLFIASAFLASGPFGGSAAAPAAAPARSAGGGAPQGGSAPAASGAADQRFGTAPSATPAPGEERSSASQTQTPKAQLTSRDESPSATAAPAAPRSDTLGYEARRPQLGPSPLFWLAAAVGFGALAIVLNRRLRAP